jgi:hypothetical protein
MNNKKKKTYPKLNSHSKNRDLGKTLLVEGKGIRTA